jgi:hypothetical protein
VVAERTRSLLHTEVVVHKAPHPVEAGVGGPVLAVVRVRRYAQHLRFSSRARTILVHRPTGYWMRIGSYARGASVRLYRLCRA